MVSANLLLLFTVGLHTINALDIAFSKIVCNQSLPAFVLEDNVSMTCDSGQKTRCTFGSTVQITGSSRSNAHSHYTLNM
jgi:hypothetical protein